MTVDALYQINTFDITTSVVKGTITPSQTASHGDDVVITYCADAGCYLAGVTVDGAALTDLTTYQDSYTFENIDADHTIAVKYAVKQYTVKFFAQDGSTQIGDTQTVAWNVITSYSIHYTKLYETVK